MFPENVGVPFGESTRYFMTMMLADNPDLTPGIRFKTGLDLLFTSKTREMDAGLFQIGLNSTKTYSLTVPPNSTNYVLSSHCPTPCTAGRLNLFINESSHDAMRLIYPFFNFFFFQAFQKLESQFSCTHSIFIWLVNEPLNSFNWHSCVSWSWSHLHVLWGKHFFRKENESTTFPGYDGAPLDCKWWELWWELSE